MPRSMFRLGVALIAAGAVWACASAPAPDPIVAPPPPQASAPTPAPTPPPSQPAPPQTQPPSSGPGSGTVVVIAPTKPAPPGDIRSVAERRRDRQSYDRCVMQAQAELDKRGPNAVIDSPEEICLRRMGMRDRDSAPNSR